jgi:integrase
VAARATINKAFDNDMVTGETVKVFRRVRKMLKRNANSRYRILTPDEFKTLMDKLPRHWEAILATGFYTGMRRSEVFPLTWDKVDMEKRIIRLQAEDTKNKEPRVIPSFPMFMKSSRQLRLRSTIPTSSYTGVSRLPRSKRGLSRHVKTRGSLTAGL